MNQFKMLTFKPTQEPIPDALDRLELKPERVQEEMARQLGWAKREGMLGIHRARKFASYLEAEAYAAFVFRMAAHRRQPVTVSQSGAKVSITLTGRSGRHRASGITNAVYDLACVLG
jgi:pterin-4a-carbinolamine dehydratase